MNDFKTGVNDAKNDLLSGWVPKNPTLSYIISNLTATMGASDAYIAGYVSVIFV